MDSHKYMLRNVYLIKGFLKEVPEFPHKLLIFQQVDSLFIYSTPALPLQ
jgi:hypothetical protein